VSDVTGRVSIDTGKPGRHDPRLLSRVVATSTGSRREAMEFFRCQICGEAIGVYEPLVVRLGDRARTTSRAAEPDLKATDAPCYHRDCYAES
jgi:hypothetical protein